MNRGFTLLEVVVVIGLMVAGMAALVLMYFSFSALYGLGHATAGTATAARAVLEETEAAVLPAVQILSVHIFSTGTHTTSTTTLVAEVPAIDATGAVVIGKYDYIAIYLSGEYVYRRIEADPASERTTGTKQLTQDQTELSFTYDNIVAADITSVVASTTVTRSVRGTPVDTSLISQFSLRNRN